MTTIQDEKKICANPKCKKDHYKKGIYCSDICRWQGNRAAKKSNTMKRGLGDILDTDQEKRSAPTAFILKEEKLGAPPGLDPQSTFIVNELSRQRDKLEKQRDELEDDVKTLTREKAELEKQLEKTSTELSAKPTGLQGLMNDPDKLMGVVNSVPSILEGITNMIRAGREALVPEQSVAGLPEGQQDPVMGWISTLPEDTRTAFLSLIEDMKRMNVAQIANMISYTRRNAMSMRKAN